MFRTALATMSHIATVVASVVIGAVTISAAPLGQEATSDDRVIFATSSALAIELASLGSQGYRCVAVAKAEQGLVVPGAAVIVARPANHAFDVDRTRLRSLHFLRGRFVVGDHTAADEYTVIADRSLASETTVESDPLPSMGSSEATASSLDLLGVHLTRNKGFTPTDVRLTPGPNGTWTLTTILSRSQ